VYSVINIYPFEPVKLYSVPVEFLKYIELPEVYRTPPTDGVEGEDCVTKKALFKNLGIFYFFNKIQQQYIIQMILNLQFLVVSQR